MHGTDKISSCFTMIEKILRLLHLERPRGLQESVLLVLEVVRYSFFWTFSLKIMNNSGFGKNNTKCVHIYFTNCVLLLLNLYSLQK